MLLDRVETILRDNERHVLALAHALESHKTLSGEDVTAVLEGGRGPLVDGTPYLDDEFIGRLREYHQAAERAHREHNVPQLPMPIAVVPPALVGGPIAADGYGASANGSPNGDGSPSPTYDPPTYNPPTYGPPDGSA